MKKILLLTLIAFLAVGTVFGMAKENESFVSAILKYQIAGQRAPIQTGTYGKSIIQNGYEVDYKTAYAQRRGPGMMDDYGWGHMDGWHNRGFFGGWWMWLIAIILIGAVIYFAVKSSQNKETGRSGDALEILKKRYARGEITKEEYDSMKKDLKE
jgi:putative membrane protein